MHAPVRARLEMPWMVREIGIFAVFDDEPSFVFQYILVEDDIRQSRELLQCIRRVSKNKVVFGPAGIEKLEYIASYHTQIVDA